MCSLCFAADAVMVSLGQHDVASRTLYQMVEEGESFLAAELSPAATSFAQESHNVAMDWTGRTGAVYGSYRSSSLAGIIF